MNPPKPKSPKRRCRYWKRKLTIHPFCDMEFFLIPLVWQRITDNDKLFPLCSTKHQTHVLLIVDGRGFGHIIASPKGSPAGHAYKGHARRWEKFCKALDARWWAYLPSALPPRTPTKKRYSEGELARGYTPWKVHQSAVKDETNLFT